jgi:hypothetical protein
MALSKGLKDCPGLVGRVSRNGLYHLLAGSILCERPTFHIVHISRLVLCQRDPIRCKVHVLD